MALISGGIISEESWDGFVSLSRAALLHMVEHGEVPEFVGEPMTTDQAVAFLEDWLQENKLTLIEGGFDFLAGLARSIAIGDEPEQPIEEFEDAIKSLTDEQLTAISEGEADQIEAAKVDVIDRRREMVASLLATGRVLLRGALASALYAALGAS